MPRCTVPISISEACSAAKQGVNREDKGSPLYDRTHRERRGGMKVALCVASFLPSFSMGAVIGLPLSSLAVTNLAQPMTAANFPVERSFFYFSPTKVNKLEGREGGGKERVSQFTLSTFLPRGLLFLSSRTTVRKVYSTASIASPQRASRASPLKYSTGLNVCEI